MASNNADRISYRVDEAREKLGLRRTKFYDLIAKNEIESIRVGRQLLIPRDALENFIRRKRRQAQAAAQ